MIRQIPARYNKYWLFIMKMRPFLKNGEMYTPVLLYEAGKEKRILSVPKSVLHDS